MTAAVTAATAAVIAATSTDHSSLPDEIKIIAITFVVIALITGIVTIWMVTR